MLARINTAAMVGLDARMVEVEVDISPGLPGTLIVGLKQLPICSVERLSTVTI